ncbi:MAG: Rne/Rng family ribonuclease [Alphaproteobacteria bacterium]
MTKRMLIDATHKEETRVAITDGNKLIEYDYESQTRKPLKGSIFLAKVTRVEPSLQAAFVNFGGNRHGFLPFSEIHPDYFRIPVADREALMAEQEALLQEHDEEEDGIDDAEDAVEDDVDDVIEPEEVGGEIGVLDEGDVDSEAETDDKPKKKKPVKSKAKSKSNSKEGNVVADENSKKSDDAEDAEDAVDDDVSADFDGEASEGGGDEKDSDDRQKRGRGRNNYRGRGGRNNGRGRGRMQNRNSSVEVVGGEEIDEEQRFRFNLRRKYKIQEVIKRGQIMLVQVNKEERGNKGAAVGSYLSLPGRYCVLMPNSPRAGGVSRKIANHKDRARMREIVKDLEVPKGMSVIVRTAGVSRTKVEIKRDLDYLMRLWDNIRNLTLESSAPAMVYEEADLIKRSVRDLYTREVEEILVAGQEGFENAKDFMKMMIPSHVKKVVQYEGQQLPLFNRYQIESQIDEIGLTEVRLKSGGYLVINPTEALVSIDVNSGKATKGRHIEETAVKTNLEAAEEVARQLKLRDLGGLVVIDFIDMEDRRNNGKVERRMKDALSQDRARIQVGRISSFGLMELSRQRLSPSLTEAQYEKCSKCNGLGLVRTADAMSLLVLRAIEEEGIRARAAQIIVEVSSEVALYILNYKRKKMAEIEERYNFQVLLRVDDKIPASEYRLEVAKPVEDNSDVDSGDKQKGAVAASSSPSSPPGSDDENDDGNNKRRRGRRGGRRRNNNNRSDENGDQNGNVQISDEVNDVNGNVAEKPAKDVSDEKPKRGGRGRKKKEDTTSDVPVVNDAKPSAANDSDDKKEEKKPARKKAVSKKKDDKEAVDSLPKADVAEEKPKKAVSKAASKKEEKVVKQPEPVNKDYEVVNQAPKEKKKGWWNRL